jgi:hypothetical protein
MSIRPITFNPDGSIECVYDELGHSGTIAAADIHWSTDLDGSDNHNFIVLECPDGCGGVSTHPVGGGADAPNVQQMFVNKVNAEGCACAQVTAADTDALGESHVRLNVNRMDGMGRWQLDTPAQIEAYENSPTMFQVVMNQATRLVVGLEPSGGGVGQGNQVVVIHDMAEYDNLMRYDPAYVSADGDHIVGSPA